MWSRAVRRPFTTIYSNLHIKPIVEYDNKKYVYDGQLNEYPDAIKEYLRKRWTTKPEICTLASPQGPKPTSSTKSRRSATRSPSRICPSSSSCSASTPWAACPT